MRNSRRTARFRALIADGELHVRPSAYDAHSAKILERLGFDVIGISGYCVSVSMLGKPDVGLVTVSETARVCRDICGSVSIPVMADADTGYGDALNAMRTVDTIIEAGAGGLFIEDQIEPKRCGHVQGKQLLPFAEAVDKDARPEPVDDHRSPISTPFSTFKTSSASIASYTTLTPRAEEDPAWA
jgi:2-methylisocitrate lyase-like PEP mutase family enzyme